jgi:hypothetical protein
MRKERSITVGRIIVVGTCVFLLGSWVAFVSGQGVMNDCEVKCLEVEQWVIDPMPDKIAKDYACYAMDTGVKRCVVNLWIKKGTCQMGMCKVKLPKEEKPYYSGRCNRGCFKVPNLPLQITDGTKIKNPMLVTDTALFTCQ